MSEEKNSTSVKELAAKLKVSDALLKKIVKDFGIETTKVKNRVHLEDQGVQTIREIMALRASGKKTKEIKELFDASKPEDKKVEEDKSEKAEKKEDKTKDKAKKDTKAKEKKDPKAKKDSKKDTKPKKKEAKADSEDSTEDESEEQDDSKRKLKNKNTKNKDKSKDRSKKKGKRSKSDDTHGVDAHDLEDDHKDGMLNLNEYIDGNDNDNDFKARLNEDLDEEELKLDEDLDEEIEEEDEEEEEVVDKKSGSKTKAKKQQKFRRRQFSYKYIQRQIMNDQKRVKYIQQKLKRGRLSTKERMQLEESLEIRDKLLAGWIKLLRWVKS